MKLSLHTTASILIIGIGILLLGVTIPVSINNVRNNNGFFEDGFGFFMLFGFAYFASGIMMLIRHKSATTFTTYTLTASMVGWVAFAYSIIIKESDDGELILYALSIFIFIFLVVLTLFINNDKVIASLTTNEEEEELRSDILDSL